MNRSLSADAIEKLAQPITDQHSFEIQPFGHLVRMPIALDEHVCRESVENLNQILADTLTLRDMYKKHHWQVSGPTFYQLHLLFDKHHKEQGELADEIAELRQKTSTIDTYRDIVNYNYWLARCLSEPTDECLEARKLLFDAGQAYDVQGSLFDARDLYDKAFAKWRIVLDKFPVLRSNNIMADDLVDEINKYKKILGKIAGAKFPSPFILQDMIDLNEGKRPATEQKSEAKPNQPEETAAEAKDAQK